MAVSAAFALCAGYVWLETALYYLWATPKHRLESAWMVLVFVAGLTAAVRDRYATQEEQVSWQGLELRTILPTAIAALGLAFALYWRALGIELLSDDFVLLDKAASPDWWRQGEWEFFRPVAVGLWRIALWFSSTPASGLHGLNVALHGLNATLVTVLAQRLGLTVSQSRAAGILFLCFPGAAESVAWASGLHDVLMTATVLVFVLIALDPRDTADPIRLTAAATCLLAGFFSKETAVIGPILALLLAAAAPGRPRWTVIGFGILLSLAYATWRVVATTLPDDAAISISRYAVKELLSRCFGTLAIPFAAGELSRYAWVGFVLATAHLLAIGVAVMGSARTPRSFVTLLALLGGIVVTVVPAFAYLFVGPDLQGSRYLYLAASLWAILLVKAMAHARLVRTHAGVGVMLLATTGGLWHVSLRERVASWEQAAGARDRALDRFRDAHHVRGCAVVEVSGIPDSTRGAYVFRNGLELALRREGLLGPDQRLGPASGHCVLDLGSPAARPLQPGAPGGG